MVDDGLSKNQAQRKKRNERETCINNVKLNVNLTSTKDYHRSQIEHYPKKPKKKFLRGSLENVSSNPWGEPQVEGLSSLRRSRSLAISRDNLLHSLDFPSNTRTSNKSYNSQQRRSQLIPRAKLIDRSSSKELRYKTASVENLERTIIKRKSITEYSPTEEEIYYYHQQDHQEVNQTQPDSLESGYHKSSVNSVLQISYEEFPGLSLPNYYPDSKYDTDNTGDNLSLIDSVSLDNNNNHQVKTKYSSCENITWDISYDDNIVLSGKKYEQSKEGHYARPRTIRGPTPFRENYCSKSTQPIYSSIPSDEDKLTTDEINRNYSQHTTLCSYSNIETNPLYGQLDESSSKESLNETIKTLIEVEGKANSCEGSIVTDPEQFKTVVAVDDCNSNEEEIAKDAQKQHSHNYLREFLETQKGSKKPLQNFIAKKLSNLSRRHSKEICTNLAENQFHSLPDITISKNLKKCEKIDRKLRKYEKTNLSKTKSESSENRFIVNIGRHFDITSNPIPVDFEVKISKVPKKKPNEKSDEQLIEAVKNLKETLHGSRSSLDNVEYPQKPEIVSVITKSPNMDNKTETEYKEKIGTMRNYWNKFIINKPEVEEEITPCKVVDVQTKVENVIKKFEPNEEVEKPVELNKVQLAKQLFEPKPAVEKQEKRSAFIKESCNYFENELLESLNPNIVEIIDAEKPKASPRKRVHKPVSKSKSITVPEFDHVRYRVVKSDLFQKKIFANCEKESQFDGLLQYLQDYSFQELLIDNNIVIIEPIRTKVQYENKNHTKTVPKNITPLLHTNKDVEPVDEENKINLKRHFFYHPIRVNKEVNDDELPNPDTVRQARQFFEGGLKRSLSSQELENISKEKFNTKSMIDPDKDLCSATDSNSLSDFDGQEILYDSINSEHCCEQQYVSEDIMEKIRECGTTVTYYGGRVVKHQVGQPILTKVIMEEIRDNEKRNECRCRKNSVDNKDKEGYQGVKFRLVKSNSCSSRLELVGTENVQESRKKFISKHKQLYKRNGEKESNCIKEAENEFEMNTKNAINESIKLNSSQPKIIGEERKSENKMMQWGEINKDRSYASITFNEKSVVQKKNTEYHNYDKLKMKAKTINEMEFEPYEVA